MKIYRRIQPRNSGIKIFGPGVHYAGESVYWIFDRVNPGLFSDHRPDPGHFIVL